MFISDPDVNAAEARVSTFCYPGQMHHVSVAKGATIIVTAGRVTLSYREGRLSWLLSDATTISVSVSDGSAFVMPCNALITLCTGGSRTGAFFIEDVRRVTRLSRTWRFTWTLFSRYGKVRPACR